MCFVERVRRREGAEYLETMIISGGLAGEHGVLRGNNLMEVVGVNTE